MYIYIYHILYIHLVLLQNPGPVGGLLEIHCRRGWTGNKVKRSKVPTGMSMELSNYLIIWVVTYLEDIQPTYIGIIIYVLSSMNILVLPKTLYVMSGGYSKDHLPCQESCARDRGHQHCVVCERKEKKPPCESWWSFKKGYTPWKSSTILEDDLTPY